MSGVVANILILLGGVWLLILLSFLGLWAFSTWAEKKSG